MARRLSVSRPGCNPVWRRDSNWLLRLWKSIYNWEKTLRGLPFLFIYIICLNIFLFVPRNTRENWNVHKPRRPAPLGRVGRGMWQSVGDISSMSFILHSQTHQIVTDIQVSIVSKKSKDRTGFEPETVLLGSVWKDGTIFTTIFPYSSHSQLSNQESKDRKTM